MDCLESDPISIDAIIDNKVYIGNISAALSLDLRKELGISHILSVCPENESTSPNHLTIPVQDSEYEDLLIHLPQACQFIQSALDEGGKVLVHCLMGVSRSTTVVCAYLMWTRRISAAAAIQYIRKRRPQVHPNFGFTKQLQTFAECRYKPTCTNSEYIAWKRRQKHVVTKYLNTLNDIIPVIHEQLYLTSDFPGDPDAAESLLLDTGMTHVLSIASAQLPTPKLPSNFHHFFIDIPNQAREALLLELPTACRFIGEAIAAGGQVLVQCRVELRACIMVSAYLMSTRHLSSRNAFSVWESALPFYTPTTNFFRHLEVYEACAYAPTLSHPVVQAWLVELASGTKPIPRATCTIPLPKTGVVSSASSNDTPSISPPTASPKKSPVSSPLKLPNDCLASSSPFDMTILNEALALGRFHKTGVVEV
ncbi:protein-tyrosine phosphatase-like protein [Hygrophoropsis aurantiaca]|uniref:Protein-tyrosine phosphatase-like protein n=1 Tax=Hygrophoropsis aurantiaca TaxID=72124 RepID=A0ACB8AA53_9AGAM|nr:protein-tyrosine phosphatase-like protein [Hygrophoropsis aurantiaca]